MSSHRISRTAIRGTPSRGDIVLVNDKCIGRITSLDWDVERIEILRGDLGREAVKIIIALDEEALETLKNTRPHLFI